MTDKSRVSPFMKQCFVTAAVCFNIIGHGCSLGFPGVLLPELHKPGSPISISIEAESWITSVGGISLLIGNFITPRIMEQRGRRTAHLAVTLPMLAGWIVTILSTSVTLIILGRILQGISFGMLLPLRSPLLGEYTSPKNRGGFLTMVSFAQAFGIFFVHLVGSLLSWQKTALICLFFTFISLIMIFYSPETPSWLLSKGRHDECRENFRSLRGDQEEEELEAMIAAKIKFDKETLSRKENKISPLRRLGYIIVMKEFYWPIILMFHLYFMVQYAGGVTMATYSTVIISNLMGPNASAHFWMVELDTQRIISNAIAVFMVNKMKRRTLLFLVGALNVGAHLALAGYAYMRTHGILSYDAIWVPALLLNLHMFSVASGMVPLPNVIAGEVFPLQFRSTGSSLSLISISLFFFISLKTFPVLINSIGLHGTYALYASFITYNLVVAWFLLPETKGKTLQQIEEWYRGGKPLSAEEVASRQSLNRCKEDTEDRKMSIEL